MSDRRELLKKILGELVENLTQAEIVLKKTLEDIDEKKLIAKITNSETLSWEEMNLIEAFAARFARLSDIFTQKFLRIIDELELVFDGSNIDRLNRAEKRGLIDSTETFMSIRELRNDISHEYKSADVLEVFIHCYKMSEPLLKATKKAVEYSSV
jgi:hypothetical protein